MKKMNLAFTKMLLGVMLLGGIVTACSDNEDNSCAEISLSGKWELVKMIELGKDKLPECTTNKSYKTFVVGDKLKQGYFTEEYYGTDCQKKTIHGAWVLKGSTLTVQENDNSTSYYYVKQSLKDHKTVMLGLKRKVGTKSEFFVDEKGNPKTFYVYKKVVK
ncbi:MAG: lipocalin family protein [Flavobacteriaceae bacterium]|nr:lipocalin family protein [Flavobacteriaceae bacterium]